MLLKPTGASDMPQRRSVLITAEALERNRQLHESLRAELAQELAENGTLGSVGRRLDTDHPGLRIRRR